MRQLENYLHEAPEWTRLRVIRGFEGEEDKGSEGGTEGEGEKGREESEGEGGDGGEEGDKGNEGLKSALKKERINSRNAIAESKRLTAELEALKKASEKSESDKKTDDAPKVDAATQRKLAKLTEGFRDAALKTTVSKLAKDFEDPDDVFSFIDTSLIDFTQDDDDPTNVVWDEAELRTAIKELKKSKPYLLKSGDGGGSGDGKGRKSASKFGGTGTKSTDAQETAALFARFPAMRGIRPPATK